MDTPASEAAPAIAEDVARLLAREGWQVARSSRPDEPDIFIAKGSLSYAVEIKVARDGRRSALEGLMADAVLRSHSYARRRGASTRALAIAAAPALSSAMRGALRQYVGKFVPEAAFGLIDSRGRYEFHGEGLEGLVKVPARRARRTESLPRKAFDLFSDLNQWLLKVLLGGYFPEGMIRVPRGPIGGAADLARLAQASIPSAWRCLSALEDLGFVENGPGGIEIVRRDDLLDAWLSAVRRPIHERRTALALPVKDPLEILGPRVAAYRSGDRRIAWGTFVAASKLGHEFVRGAPLHLYVDDIGQETLDRLQLTAVAEHEPAHVILREARWPESAFRAAVDRDGQPFTDVIQCWLDVSRHPARGGEQADALWRRVIAPALGIQGRPAGSQER